MLRLTFPGFVPSFAPTSRVGSGRKSVKFRCCGSSNRTRSVIPWPICSAARAMASVKTVTNCLL
jgi:hypothetical protein